MIDGRPLVLVDDDPAHRDLIASLVGIAAPSAPTNALVLLDRRLGPRDALALLPALHALRPDLEIAVMSAFVTPEDRALLLAAGATSVFEKPGDLNGWRATLLSLLNAPDTTLRAA
jgi:CheY-like chemotaxis protein